MELLKPLTKEKQQKFWKLIRKSKWVKYKEHYPKAHDEFFMKELKYDEDFTEFVEMENFLILLLMKLDKKFDGYQYITDGGDDDWFNLLGNVIARGEKYYNNITLEQMEYLVNRNKCYEGFLTDFEYCHPWNLLQKKFLKTIIKFK